MAGHKPGQRGPTSPAVTQARAPSPEAIASRAYDIYVANGRREGRAREDRLQAERQLEQECSARSASETQRPAPADPRAKHSELLNGTRPKVDARLIKAVMGAGKMKRVRKGRARVALPADCPPTPETRPARLDAPADDGPGEDLAVPPLAVGRREVGR